MTLDELTDFVTKKVGQIDAYSQGVCQTFINRRYQMIHDSENWQDTMATGSVSTIVSNGVVAIPATFQRVAKLKIIGGNVLENVTEQYMLESHPDLMAGESAADGEPIFYSELSTGGTQYVRLYPAPDKIYQLYFWGKKLFVGLVTGTDTPVIRNIDNCLLAFVMGDMLQRARQYTKAKECIEEAGTLLELMRKVEKQQSNLPRRSKTITVSGDSLAEMVDAVCNRIDDYTDDTQSMVQEYLRRTYADLWDSQMWLESTVMARVTRDGPELVLPEYIDRIIAMRANSNLGELIPSSSSYILGVAPSVFEQSGSPVNFSILTPSAVANLPINNEQMSLVSSDAADTSRVFIRGETGGAEVNETVTLNGTTEVFTVYTYDMPMTLAKGLTVGYIDVYGRVSGAFLVRLLADERERKHIRLWLLPTPVDAIDGTECLVLGKRKIHPLLTDEDTPILRGIANVLINSACAEWFTKAGNDKAAAAAEKKAKESLSVMIDREAKQTANRPMIVPYNDGVAFGESWDGALATKGYW